MDFTLKKYRELLIALKGYGNVILRHDVDKKPQNSLKTARIEHELGWKAIYYFRAVPESWDEFIIKEIASLGHDIGYHYESLATCKGDIDMAYNDFCVNLERLRKIAPVNSICMHGTPKSPWDSKDIWEKYDYKNLGILFEPYLDTDFSSTFYITDTGRRWDGYKVSRRDVIPDYQELWEKQGLKYHTTDDIIHSIITGSFPRNTMITTHPQRWHDNQLLWLKELIFQNAKNVIKRILILHDRKN